MTICLCAILRERQLLRSRKRVQPTKNNPALREEPGCNLRQPKTNYILECEKVHVNDNKTIYVST